MSLESLDWPTGLICLSPDSIDVSNIAAILYERVCRTDFQMPGFCLLKVGRDPDSHTFRQLMIDLAREVAKIHKLKTCKTLVHLTASRFDQQVSTKPHLDGGPDENFLMLGYEPSDVESELEIFDYTKCAFDLGITPKQFMDQHNPMFNPGYELLRTYATRVNCFASTDYQVVCINNSSANYSMDVPAWQGVLHTATVSNPDESKRRVINSTMLAPSLNGTTPRISESEMRDFVETLIVRRQGCDKPDLADDR